MDPASEMIRLKGDGLHLSPRLAHSRGEKHIMDTRCFFFFLSREISQNVVIYRTLAFLYLTH